ncbi:DUF488 domain-containing protein [Pseudomonas sp. HR96]|uniref:DUF488 domain-containing protein n=1 Tax=Pseudomonas sp. HR96 TaxID=1027966 RepID=UPI002A755946|nr:DUF488 domain-containing protein [Pseudomonas sp. HR96]WPP00557.1 DUF488 domain-containing protein [Pseudomonas sp. HR96]
MPIYTAGYEGLSIETFIARLKQAGIDKVLDVREYPLSRKPGFSKKAFAACLAESGITYEHCPPLGCPKPIRNQYKIDGNWSLYAQNFRAYIRTQPELLLSLTTEAAKQRICMVCYEADARFCHRSLIAEAAQELDPTLKARHLPSKMKPITGSIMAIA